MVMLLGSGLSQVSAFTEFDALKRAHEEELFSMDTTLSSEKKLQRQEAAGIFTNFIKNIVRKDFLTNPCKAKDLNGVDKKYQTDVETLCEYGIMQGEDNKLLPKQGLTRAQAIVMAVRILDSPQRETVSQGQHRAENHYKKARDLGIDTKSISVVKNQTISFQELINLLYMSQHPDEKFEKTTSNTTSNKTTTSASSNREYTNSNDILNALAEILKD